MSDGERIDRLEARLARLEELVGEMGRQRGLYHRQGWVTPGRSESVT